MFSQLILEYPIDAFLLLIFAGLFSKSCKWYTLWRCTRTFKRSNQNLYLGRNVRATHTLFHIQSSSSFFRLWWETQDAGIKEKLQQLINNGQFEFVGGKNSQTKISHSEVDGYKMMKLTLVWTRWSNRYCFLLEKTVYQIYIWMTLHMMCSELFRNC